MKWAEMMPTYKDDDETVEIFIFNHVITWFSVPWAIAIDHCSHFHNFMMTKLSAQLDLHHYSSTPYYPQANGQFKVINKVLTNMIKRIVGIHKGNWNTMLFQPYGHIVLLQKHLLVSLPSNLSMNCSFTG